VQNYDSLKYNEKEENKNRQMFGAGTVAERGQAAEWGDWRRAKLVAPMYRKGFN